MAGAVHVGAISSDRLGIRGILGAVGDWAAGIDYSEWMVPNGKR